MPGELNYSSGDARSLSPGLPPVVCAHAGQAGQGRGGEGITHNARQGGEYVGGMCANNSLPACYIAMHSTMRVHY
jgi:hypothetical protein